MGMSIWLQVEPDYSLGTGLYSDGSELTFAEIRRYFPLVEIPATSVYSHLLSGRVYVAFGAMGLKELLEPCSEGVQAADILPELKKRLADFEDIKSPTDECREVIGVLSIIVRYMEIDPTLTLHTNTWKI